MEFTAGFRVGYEPAACLTLLNTESTLLSHGFLERGVPIIVEPLHERALRLHTDHQPGLPLAALDLEPSLITARFEWAVQQGHPAYLWPDVPMYAWRSCLFEIERATAKILHGSAGVRLELPEGAEPRALGMAAFTSGMGPLLGLWLEQRQLVAAQPVADLLALHLAHGRLRAARFTAELAAFTSCLGEQGIPVTVIKGAYTAHAFFPDPGARPAVDIDVVLEPGDVRAANSALTAAGYRPSVVQRRPYRCDWIPPSASTQLRSIELTHAENPLTIEVHDSLDRLFGLLHTVQLGPLSDHAVPGTEVLHTRKLREPANLAFLALHASEQLHQLQLIRLVELVEVMRRNYAQPAAWADLAALLERYGAMRFGYPAFELAERLVPGTVDPEFRRRLAYHAHPRLRRVVENVSPATAQRPDRLSLEESLLWAVGAWQIVRRIAYLLWPARITRSRRSIAAAYQERLYRLFRGRIGLR